MTAIERDFSFLAGKGEDRKKAVLHRAPRASQSRLSTSFFQFTLCARPARRPSTDRKKVHPARHILWERESVEFFRDIPRIKLSRSAALIGAEDRILH